MNASLVQSTKTASNTALQGTQQNNRSLTIVTYGINICMSLFLTLFVMKKSGLAVSDFPLILSVLLILIPIESFIYFTKRIKEKRLTSNGQSLFFGLMSITLSIPIFGLFLHEGSSNYYFRCLIIIALFVVSCVLFKKCKEYKWYKTFCFFLIQLMLSGFLYTVFAPIIDMHDGPNNTLGYAIFLIIGIYIITRVPSFMIQRKNYRTLGCFGLAKILLLTIFANEIYEELINISLFWDNDELFFFAPGLLLFIISIGAHLLFAIKSQCFK